MEAWTRELELPARAESIRRARDFVTATLLAAELPGLVDDARLVVSELASNAVQHAHTPFTLTVEFSAGHLMLRVRDGSPRQPSRVGTHPLADRGRGLLLVDGLSTDWGVAPQGSGGKSVWARLPIDSGNETGVPGGRGVSRPHGAAMLRRPS